jgi:hypothetical protein
VLARAERASLLGMRGAVAIEALLDGPRDAIANV